MAMARAQAFAPAYDHIENIPNNSDRHPKEYPRVRDLHFGQLSVVSFQLSVVQSMWSSAGDW
jgi:hypothetical protein